VIGGFIGDFIGSPLTVDFSGSVSMPADTVSYTVAGTSTLFKVNMAEVVGAYSFGGIGVILTRVDG
jgi:hypothetical protein